MIDERDEILAAQLQGLVTAGDPVVARQNFETARARARRHRQLSAGVAGVVLLAGGVIGVAAFGRDRGPMELSVTASTATASSISPVATTGPDTAGRSPLASEVEGRVYGLASLQRSGDPQPPAESPPRVWLSFFEGAVTGNDGCRPISASYTPGDVPLEITVPTGVGPAIQCLADTPDLVVEILSAATVSTSGEGGTLSLSGPPGVLTFVPQRYTPSSVHCVPGVDTLHQGQVTGDVRGSGEDPVEAARVQLTLGSEAPGAYLDAQLGVAIRNAEQARVDGTRDERPVLSVVLDHTDTGWAMTSYAACVSDTRPSVTTVVVSPPSLAGPVPIVGKTFHITDVADLSTETSVDEAMSAITFDADGLMHATIGCHMVGGVYQWAGSVLTVTDVAVSANVCGDASDELAASLQSALYSGSLTWEGGHLALRHPGGAMVLSPE